MGASALQIVAVSVAAFAAVMSAIAAWLAREQVREAEAGRAFDALHSVWAMVRTDEAREARRVVYDAGARHAHDLGAVKWDELPDTVRGAFESQSVICDYVGHVLESGLLKGGRQALVFDMCGDMLVLLWGAIGPYVRWRRERQGIGWQQFFQDAAAAAWAYHSAKYRYDTIRYLDGRPAPPPAAFNAREKLRIYED
jgi:hypothetical protein